MTKRGTSSVEWCMDSRGKTRAERRLLHPHTRTMEPPRSRGVVPACLMSGDEEELIDEGDAESCFYQRIVEQMSQGAARLRNDGTIFYANPGLARLLQVPHSQLVGEPMTRFIAAASQGRFGQWLQDGFGGNGQGELVLQGAHGRLIPVFVAMWPVPVQGGQDVLVLFTDLADQKRREEAETTARQMTESAQQLRSVLEGITDSYFVLDRQWRFVEMNNRAAELVFSRPREQLLGRGYWEEFPQGCTETGDCYRAAMDQRVAFHFEARSSIVPRWFETHVYPNEAGISVFIRDITQRKQAEEQLRLLNETLEQRVAERTAMAERRANQLRALAAELNQAEYRERRQLAQILHDHLQQLLVAARFKLAMLQRRTHDQSVRQRVMQVDELLDQAISESRSLTVELSPPILYDGGLIAGLEWLAQYMQEKQGLTVEIQAQVSPDPLPEDVRLLAFQAIRELLFNVTKHAKVESARVELVKLADQTLRVTVSDTGAGFDPVRLDHGGSTEGGFGLFSIRERLELVSGDLSVLTGPGQGTAVTLTIPCGPPQRVVSSAKVAKVARAAAVPPTAEVASKIRVLLADDHEILRQGLAGLLEEEPDREVVAQASDGQTAVELALRTEPDVVVMDVTMPRLSGVEATRRISAELPHVRIIGLSMHEQEEMAQAMREAGATAYLPKGDSSDALIATIRAALELAARP